ncbi:hypothetical protein JCM14635_23610 [Megalodesulfovibrio paquesii]
MLACGAALGRVLAGSEGGLPLSPPWALLLSGELGAGKTTLTRGLVSGLPGGEAAQVASPSFTLMNCYPTRPPVAHVDCYRLEPEAAAAVIPDLLEEAGPGTLAVVEWIERLPRAAWPEPALLIRWLEVARGRRMQLTSLAAELPPGLASALAPWRTDA